MNMKTQQKKLFILKPRRKKRIEKNHPSLSDLWDITKQSNIHVIGAPEREGREIVAEIFPKFYQSHESTNPYSSKNTRENKQRKAYHNQIAEKQ